MMLKLNKSRLIISAALFMVLPGCQEDSGQSASPGGVAVNQSSQATDLAQARWYTAGQVSSGAQVFAGNCAACHGDEAQGLADDWRERLPDGSFPPPPLDGSAHAWHHPLAQLMQTVETGGVPYGGQMPPFSEVLDEQQRLAAIAYFQSFWTEDIYLDWLDRGGLD